MADNYLNLLIRPMDGNQCMGDDFEIELTAKATIYDALAEIQRLKGISVHRMTLRLPDGKFVPQNREKWGLKRLGVANGNVMICEPTLSGSWYWNDRDFYIEKFLLDVLKVIREAENNMIEITSLEKQIVVPNALKAYSVRSFLRKYPEKFYIHVDTTNGLCWIMETKNDSAQLVTYSATPITLGLSRPLDLKPFDWDSYADIDDTRRLELDFKIPDKAYEISVISASNIMRADLFGASDPFGIVYFNEKEIGRTAPRKNTLNPVWRDAIFIFTVPATIELNACVLRIELFDIDAGFDGAADEIGDFLGCVEITGSKLAKFIGNGNSVILDLDLQPRLESAPDQDQSRISGTLKIRGSVSGYECCIVGGRNLVELDDRLSKPFAIAFWNKEELAMTLPERKELRDPIWNEIFPLPMIPIGKTLDEMLLEIQVWGSATEKGSEVGDKGAFMGSVQLTGPVLVNFLTRNEPWSTRVTLTMAQSKNIPLKFRKMPVGGMLTLIGGKVGLPIQPGKLLEVKVVMANRLARVSEVIFLLEWNYVQVCRSEPAAMKLVPTEDGKQQRTLFEFNQAVAVETEAGQTNCSESVLRIDVMEYSKRSIIPEILGCVIVKGEQLSELMDKPFATLQTFELQVDEEKDFKRQKLVRGEIVCRCGPASGRLESERVIGILGCRKLAKANLLGNSDPFVTITLNKVELYRTYTIDNTLNPMYDNQIYFIQMPLIPTKANKDFNGTSKGCTLAIEVWDESGFDGAKGACLGGLYFTPDVIESFLENYDPDESWHPLVSKVKGTKLGPGAEIKILRLGLRLASVIQYNEELERLAKEEAARRAEEEAERLADELARKEREYLDNIEREKQAAIAAEEARVEAERKAKEDAEIAAALEELRRANERRQALAKLVTGNADE